jgi:hypothetical protein
VAKQSNGWLRRVMEVKDGRLRRVMEVKDGRLRREMGGQAETGWLSKFGG